MKLGPVLEQEQAMASLGNLTRENMHHALFIHGPAGSGKSLAAHGLVQKLLCQRQNACGECKACSELSFFRSHSLLSLSLDDRLPLLNFAARLFQNISAASPEPRKINTVVNNKRFSVQVKMKNRCQSYLLHTAWRESYRILAGHQQKILKLLKLKKASLSKSQPLTEKMKEELFHRIHRRLELARAALHQGEELLALENLLTPDQLADLASLQNSLDTSHLSKEALLSALHWAEQKAEQKCIIIKGIEKIHPLALSVFLKHCEDPPPHTYFILIAESNTPQQLQQGLLAPLLSRTMRIAFKDIKGESLGRIAKEKFGLEVDFLQSSSALAAEQLSLRELLLSFYLETSRKVRQKTSQKTQRIEREDLDMGNMSLAWRLLRQKSALTALLYHAKQNPDSLENLPSHCQLLLEEYIEAKMPKQLKKTREGENKEFLRSLPFNFSKTQNLLRLLGELQRLQQTGRIKSENILIRIFLALEKKNL